MKRSISIILIILALFSLSACSGSSEPAPTGSYSGSDITDTDTGNIDAVPEVREGAYYISPDISVLAPEGHIVFDKDLTFTEEDCEQVGVEYSNMLTYVSVSGSTLIMTPENCLWADHPFQIHVRYKDQDYEDLTLSELDLADVNFLASVIVSGFDLTSDTYELYETDDALFFVFDCKMLNYERRYATIIDGHMIYIYGESVNELSDEQHELLKEVVDSFEV